MRFDLTNNNMSFDQLSSLESQPTTMRTQDAYADDPEFNKLSQDLMNKLFTLTGNISRLSNQVALLGTKRDTERVRERVHDLLEETKDDFKNIGEGVKRIQAWDDVSVCCTFHLAAKRISANRATAIAKIHPTKALPRVSSLPPRIPKRPTHRPLQRTCIDSLRPRRPRRCSLTLWRRSQRLPIRPTATTRTTPPRLPRRSRLSGLFDCRTRS